MLMVLVCLVGGVGAVARAVTDRLFAFLERPWLVTLMINLVGSFLLGLAAVAVPGAAATVIGVGFCGGFTTFSSASWQCVELLGRRKRKVAVAYVGATVAGCLSLAWLGGQLGSLLG